ncbi:MAG: pilus assembly protein PilM [Hyphomicrobiales bacterium]|nr:pilus assembly protein PilM [Rickettsiales bacterium]MCP5362314.1 pilus assembly protein PilM [Hyphomicrobiales bacterium]
MLGRLLRVNGRNGRAAEGAVPAPAFIRKQTNNHHGDHGQVAPSWKRFFQHFSDRKEASIAVDITMSCVRICQMEYEHGRWILKDLASAPIEGVATAEEMEGFQEAYATALNTLIKEHKIKAHNAAIALPVSCTIIKTLTMPMMAESDMAQAAAMGALWDNFVQLPAPLEEYEIFYEILRRDEDANTMDVLFVAAARHVIEWYSEVVSKAGLRPVVVDVRCFALNNAFSINASAAELEGRVAFLKFGPEENYLHIMDEGEPFLYELYLSDQERENILPLMEDDAFIQRYGRQVRQTITTHEAKHGNRKISHVYVVCSLPGAEAMIARFSQNFPEYHIEECHFFDHLTVPEHLKKLVGNETSRSKWAIAMGMAVRQLDLFNCNKEEQEVDHVNLLPAIENFKYALKMGMLARLGLVVSSIAALLFASLSTIQLHRQENAISAQLSSLAAVEYTHSTKTDEIVALKKVIKKLESLETIRSELPVNQELLLGAYEQVSTKIPYGVWLKELQFNAPGTLQVVGNALGDQAILQFIRQLSDSGAFERVSLKNMVAQADSYTQPLKTFTLSLIIPEPEKSKSVEQPMLAEEPIG